LACHRVVKGEEPFKSESLDALAEVMQAKQILKRNKLTRYYKIRTIMGGICFLGRIFIDEKYLESLLPDEVLALGAHEFSHLTQRHGIKRFYRIVAPTIIIGTIIGALVFFNFSSFGQVSSFLNLGKELFSLLAAVLSTLLTIIISLYANAKWLCQQETDCDLSSVKFLNNEAMASALIKLNNLHPKKTTRLDRLLPKSYPVLEQRISDIRIAAENKRRQA
jgi:Zn-dependent protease with chaperone function